jgi:hypothetical protein
MRKRQCPECGQYHFKRAQVIYESGTRTGRSSGPRYDVSYHNQSSIAWRHSPPVFGYRLPDAPLKRILQWTYIVIIALLCSPAILYVTHWNVALAYFHEGQKMAYFMKYGFVFPLAFSVCVFAYIHFSKVYERQMQFYWVLLEQHNQAYEAWQNTWVCMDCGHEMI